MIDFVARAKEVHGDRYDYSMSVYLKSKMPVTIICRKHGPFEQTPNAHLRGANCFKCGKDSMGAKQQLDNNSFVSKARETHGNRYDYSFINYVDSRTKVTIICREHGPFDQTPGLHIMGNGCRLCAIKDRKMNATMTIEDFLSSVIQVHSDRYDYSNVKYTGMGDSIEIVCKKHGGFYQRAGDHLYKKAGCPSCGVRFSAAETEICALIESLGLDYVKSDRTLLKPLEVDILVPSKQIAIEYNGLKWHSEELGKDRWYHLDKTEKARSKGYRLIHLWENDWIENKQLQLDFIKHQLGFSEQKLYARKCEIKPSPDKSIINDFLDKFHLQGSCVFTHSVCLFNEGKIVSVSCFTRRNDSFELVRHCNCMTVVGALGKTVRHFIRLTRKRVYTFLDVSRFSGDSYVKAGFTVESIQGPDYSYVKQSKRYHKFLFRKERIKTKLPEFYNEKLTERQMMKNAGYQRLWDCGKIKYVMTP